MENQIPFTSNQGPYNYVFYVHNVIIQFRRTITKLWLLSDSSADLITPYNWGIGLLRQGQSVISTTKPNLQQKRISSLRNYNK